MLGWRILVISGIGGSGVFDEQSDNPSYPVSVPVTRSVCFEITTILAS